MIVRSLSAVLFWAATFPVLAEQSPRIPVPVVTLYPGDIIGETSLIDAAVSPAEAGAALNDRAKLIGRMARRTLLSGKPILPGAVDEPRLVANGASVRILFDEPGLQIATTGQALQPGTRGELIRVRNIESGVTVTGVVQADGSVKVGG